MDGLSQQQQQQQNPLASLAALGIVVPHVAPAPAPAAPQSLAVVPVQSPDLSMDSLSFTHALGTVIDDHRRLEAYENNMRTEYAARCLQLEQHAEQVVADRTSLVVADATRNVESRRAQLHEEWLQVTSSSQVNVESVQAQSRYALQLVESHLHSEHHSALELAVSQEHNAFAARGLQSRGLWRS